MDQNMGRVVNLSGALTEAIHPQIPASKHCDQHEQYQEHAEPACEKIEGGALAAGWADRETRGVYCQRD